MDRRQFLKLSSLGIGSIFLNSLLITCNSEDISLINLQEDNRLQLIQYIENSNRGYYENHRNIYRQQRIILLITDYKLTEDPKHIVDYLAYFNVLGLIKCNFDIYRYQNTITDCRETHKNMYTLSTAIPGQKIYFVHFPHERQIIYPIKFSKQTANKELILGPAYALPCVMTKNAFEMLLQNQESRDYFKLQ